MPQGKTPLLQSGRALTIRRMALSDLSRQGSFTLVHRFENAHDTSGITWFSCSVYEGRQECEASSFSPVQIFDDRRSSDSYLDQETPG